MEKMHGTVDMQWNINDAYRPTYHTQQEHICDTVKFFTEEKSISTSYYTELFKKCCARNAGTPKNSKNFLPAYQQPQKKLYDAITTITRLL